MMVIFNEFNRLKNTYFWKPLSSASSRRSEEKRNSNSWNFLLDGKEVHVKINVSCSCRNYYCTRTIKNNGSNVKMMIPFLNKLLKECFFADDDLSYC